jgi:hypothetical protein
MFSEALILWLRCFYFLTQDLQDIEASNLTQHGLGGNRFDKAEKDVKQLSCGAAQYSLMQPLAS